VAPDQDLERGVIARDDARDDVVILELGDDDPLGHTQGSARGHGTLHVAAVGKSPRGRGQAAGDA
jgi:hypothetical protein